MCNNNTKETTAPPNHSSSYDVSYKNDKEKYLSSSYQRLCYKIVSPNSEKARAEQFFFLWSFTWIGIVFYIVYSRWFETFAPYHYLALGSLLFLFPARVPILLPPFFLSTHIHITQRYTTKANLYIGTYSWISNSFWTHYFSTVLCATYTFKAHRLNDVPFVLYMMTHSYFHFYHVLSSIMVRILWRRVPATGNMRYLYVGVIVTIASYLVAFLETFTIQKFPYYDIPDRYAILDETNHSWTLGEAFLDSMACSMIITQLLDLWRITIGKVTDAPSENPSKQLISLVPFPWNISLEPRTRKTKILSIRCSHHTRQ